MLAATCDCVIVFVPVVSTDNMLGLVKQESDMYTAPESTLSGLTFRDPETGLTYVQTQLLQVSVCVFIWNIHGM